MLEPFLARELPIAWCKSTKKHWQFSGEPSGVNHYGFNALKLSRRRPGPRGSLHFEPEQRGEGGLD